MATNTNDKSGYISGVDEVGLIEKDVLDNYQQEPLIEIGDQSWLMFTEYYHPLLKEREDISLCDIGTLVQTCGWFTKYGYIIEAYFDHIEGIEDFINGKYFFYIYKRSRNNVV